MKRIPPPSMLPIVDQGSRMSQQFRTWTQQVSDPIIVGDGTPEGVVSAVQTSIYMDSAGTAGNILYIKRDADIGGDDSQGWVLI